MKERLDELETIMKENTIMVSKSALNQLIQRCDQLERQKVSGHICALCGKPTEQIIRHHYSYFPEKIIYICPSCNNRGVLKNDHPLLNPSIDDANKFYHRGINI
jgi:hypothetical protein